MKRVKVANTIIGSSGNVFLYSNENCASAADTYKALQEKFDCTYIIYLYENLSTNEKYIYASNWEWQKLLIEEQLINHCPVFFAAFQKLQKNSRIIIPWCLAPPTDPKQRNVCGIRAEFNIDNGIGYINVGHGVRESLGLAGDVKDSGFYRHFILDPNLITLILRKMRRALVIQGHQDKLISDTFAKMQ